MVAGIYLNRYMMRIGIGTGEIYFVASFCLLIFLAGYSDNSNYAI